MFSLEELRGERGELPDEASDVASPPAEFERERFREALAAAIAGLPERERLVLSLYYERGTEPAARSVQCSRSPSRASASCTGRRW